ncbi:MAG: ice-binding family protein [Bacillota bacterium]|nr:ice-binding family protein [Bacillota bacterium]
MKTRNKTMIFLVTLCLITLLTVPAPVLAAESTVNLGTTASFAVLAGESITNTGPTTIGGSVGGNIGVSPGTSVTGFPPGIVSDGTIHSADATALQAQVDLVTAYNDAASRAVTADLTGQDLGGKTLTAGVYSFSSSAQLTGTLILDAQGDPEAVFIFQIGTTLTTASSSVVSLINGARFCRVFWQVGSSATLGTSTDFVGHVFALTSIAAQTGATVQGQLLARNGAVTLDNNTITNGVCDDGATPTPTPTTGATPTPTTGATPTPTTGASPTPTTAPDDEIP